MMDLFKDSGFCNCKSATTSMNNDCRLVKDEKLIVESSLYTRLIGKLTYLTITRPDMAYPVQQLSHF